jgi:8-oxo-dGTP pyrophosphatase MutT (NUDIX family)
VLLLLYADRWGALRVVITMRAASLRSFSGHAALPGGKADSEAETPCTLPDAQYADKTGVLSLRLTRTMRQDQIARREASEEIGLPQNDLALPKPFRIEHLCCLPPSLARTHLVVVPCVAFLHADRLKSGEEPPVVEESLIPRLDAREVAAVFSAPFYNFLKVNDLPPPPGQTLPDGHWYDGSWLTWKDNPWRVHNFYVPVNNQRVSKPRHRRDSSGITDGQANLADKLEEEEETEGRFRVWGMTGRLLVDAARIAYGEEPEMEHNLDYGDTKIINIANEDGSFEEVSKSTEKETNGEPAKM